MSARDLDSHPDGADRRVVRAALRGDPGARAVLAARFECVPLEVAAVAGTGDEAEFVARTRRVVQDVARALPAFDGSDLDRWLRDTARQAVEPTGPADDPSALAALVDVEAALDAALPHRALKRRERTGLAARLRRAPQSIRVALVATVIALFFWGDPLVDTDSGRDVDRAYGGDVRADYPVGSVGDFRRFEWRGAAESGYRAQVIVQSNDGRTITSPLLETDLWEPTEAQVRSFGNRIRWTVQVRFDGATERGWAEAWLDVR